MNPIFPTTQTAQHQITGPAGNIEILTAWPQQTAQPYIAIICHPHPLHLGTLHNKVVTTLHQAHFKLNIPTIRFNFRGVGKSEGQHDHGQGEQDDLKAVIHWAEKALPKHQLLLSGFSFGSYIAAAVANQHNCQTLISIAPPTHHQDFSQLNEISTPWLMVAAEQDEVVPYESFLKIEAQCTPAHEVITFEQCSHFFHGKLILLREQCQQWLQKTLDI